MKRHIYRLVDRSPWPLLDSIAVVRKDRFVLQGVREVSFWLKDFISALIYMLRLDKVKNLRIEGEIEKKSFFIDNFLFMDIKRLSKVSLRRKNGRYQRRRQKDYENSFHNNNRNVYSRLTHNSDKTIIEKRFFSTGITQSSFLKSIKISKNCLAEQWTVENAMKHALIYDFVKLESDATALAMYCVTSKENPISFNDGSRLYPVEVRENQFIAEVPYGLYVNSGDEANDYLEKISELSERKIDRMNIKEVATVLGKLVPEISNMVMLNGRGGKESFNTRRFNYQELQTKNELLQKANSLLNEVRD